MPLIGYHFVLDWIQLVYSSNHSYIHSDVYYLFRAFRSIARNVCLKRYIFFQMSFEIRLGFKL